MDNLIIEQARKAVETTYDCICDVIEYKAIKNETTKRTNHQEEKVIEQQKCKLSFKTIKNSNESETDNSVTQIVKLFVVPEIDIKPRFKN